MRYFYFSLSCLLIVIPGFAQTTIYENTGLDGTQIFSDMPTPSSRSYSLSGASISHFNSVLESSIINPISNPDISILPTAASSSPVLGTTPPTVIPTGYSAIIISEPKDKGTFHSQNPINVIVSTEPALQTNDKVQLMIDGTPYGEPQTNTQFTIGDLDRGTHQIQARIIAANGQPQNVSPAITIYKHQASQLLSTS